MANSNNSGNRGGDRATHEQHVRAGEQSHKNSPGQSGGQQSAGGNTRGGSSEQHAKAGSQSHKND